MLLIVWPFIIPRDDISTNMRLNLLRMSPRQYKMHFRKWFMRGRCSEVFATFVYIVRLPLGCHNNKFHSGQWFIRRSFQITQNSPYTWPLIWTNLNPHLIYSCSYKSFIFHITELTKQNWGEKDIFTHLPGGNLGPYSSSDILTYVVTSLIDKTISYNFTSNIINKVFSIFT